MPKKILVRCHSPLAVDRKCDVEWSDVWLSWTDKPGRKKYYLAPCLCSKSSLDLDIEVQNKCTADYPDLDWRDETEMLAKASEAVGAGRIYIEDSPNGTPTIYSPMEYINRDEAERMIAEVMKLHGYNDIVCKWKRTKIVGVGVHELLESEEG